MVRLGVRVDHQNGCRRTLARNEPPASTCDVCGAPATAGRVQCGYEDEGFLCVEHAGDHECGEDMVLPVVNSPAHGRLRLHGAGRTIALSTMALGRRAARRREDVIWPA